MSTPSSKKPRDGSSPIPGGHGLPLPPGSQHAYPYTQGSGGGGIAFGTHQALTTGWCEFIHQQQLFSTLVLLSFNPFRLVVIQTDDQNNCKTSMINWIGHQWKEFK